MEIERIAPADSDCENEGTMERMTAPVVVEAVGETVGAGEATGCKTHCLVLTYHSREKDPWGEDKKRFCNFNLGFFFIDEILKTFYKHLTINFGAFKHIFESVFMIVLNIIRYEFCKIFFLYFPRKDQDKSY